MELQYRTAYEIGIVPKKYLKDYKAIAKELYFEDYIKQQMIKISTR